MSYVFTREGNLGVIRNVNTNELVVSAEKATIYTDQYNINIYLGNYLFSHTYNEIGTISGVTPTSPENALFLIGTIFPGPTVAVTIS